MAKTGTIDYQHVTVLEVLTCGSCEIPFAIPETMHDRVKRDGESFYCPNGHYISYRQTENQRLSRELEHVRTMLTHAQDQRQAAERSAAAHKGQVTRLRNRAAAGVCPCCNRSFENLRRHMTSKHPDFRNEDQP